MSAPFGSSSVRRTFGSPISGSRGDYTIYPDEPWKMSLRKYADVAPNSARRCRSVSPRRRFAKAKTAARRRAIQEILAKINNTQEDLQVLAENVAVWSREAASLSDGIREEALLLELSRQADKLAAYETRNRELLKQERVSRLSLENDKLRNDLRDICRVCKLLLDVKSYDDSQSEAPAANMTPAAAGQGHGTAVDAIINRYAQSFNSGSGYSPSASATAPQRVSSSSGDAATGSSRSGRSRAPMSYTSAPQPQHDKMLSYVPPFPMAVIAAQSQGVSYTGASGSWHRFGSQSDEASEVRAGLGILADNNPAAMKMAANEVQEVGADLRVAAEARGALMLSSAGAIGMAREGKVEEEVEDVKRKGLVDGLMLRGVKRSEVRSATGDAPPEEMTLNPPRAATRSHSRSRGSGTHTSHVSSMRSGGTNTASVTAPATSLRAANIPQRHQTASFAGFLPAAFDPMQATSALPVGWQQLPHAAQEELFSRQLHAQAEEVPAQWVPGPPIANPVVTPVKQPEGYTTLGPSTPINKGRPYGSNYRYEDNTDSYGKDASKRYPSIAPATVELPTVRRSLPGASEAFKNTSYKYSEPSYGDRNEALKQSASASASSVIMTRNYDPDGGCSGSEPLNSVLMTEVEKLKSINQTLASTLQAYQGVTERLSSQVTHPAPSQASSRPTGTGTARALFPNPDEDEGAIPHVPSHSVAATYGGISSMSSSAGGAHDTPHRHGGGATARAFTSPPPVPTTPSHHYPYQQQEEQQPPPPTEVSWAYVRLGHPDGDDYTVDAVAGSSDVAKEAHRLDTTLDDQLYDIRRQLKALRHDMVADRLTTLATSATGGGGSHAGSHSGGSAALAAATHATAVAEAVLSSRGTAAARTPGLASSLVLHGNVDKAVQLARIEDEISELRRQMRVDKDWYQDRLDTIISERTAMFRDLQRRMDRLLRRT